MERRAIAIHCNPGVEWQAKRAPQFLAGLKALGLEAYITSSRERETDHAVLLGTTFWRGIEASGHYLLVDRASVGDPLYVSLVWDGHGRRGEHCVPADPHPRRWSYLNREVFEWRRDTGRIILCGQTETYSPKYPTLEHWYDEAHGIATHFRPHPAGQNPTGLPIARDWTDAGRVITLNSSVAVEAVLNGIPTVTMDEAAMAWAVSAHDPNQNYRPNREAWCCWLAWTQWHWLEIEAGKPIRHLFEGL